MLPTFLVIGAAKAGTTSLWAYLNVHPEVFMSDPKEVDFFSWNFERGLDWYERHFRRAGDARAIGEASPSYTLHPRGNGAAERIGKVLPGARLVYAVREPASRVASYYLNRFQDRVETRPLETAVREDPHYLDTTRYMFQLDRYLEHFDAGRILVIASEDLRDDRAATLERVYRFVGVDPEWYSHELEREHWTAGDKEVRRPGAATLAKKLRYEELRRFVPGFVRRGPLRRLTHRQARERIEMPADLAAWIREQVAPDVERLRAFTGLALQGWTPA